MATENAKAPQRSYPGSAGDSAGHFNLPYKNRRVRSLGWLMVLLAIGTNAVLFLTLGWINRASGRTSDHQDWTSIEVFRAKLYDEPVPQSVEEAHETVVEPAAPAEPEPIKFEPVRYNLFQPRLVDRLPEFTLDLPAITVLEPSVQPGPEPIPVEHLPLKRVLKPAGPMSLDSVDQGPKKLKCPPPSYPLWAKLEAAEAVVSLRFVIGADGQVRDTEVQHVDGDERLAQAARNAVDQWRFQPARYQGKPVAVWCVQRVRFQLND